MLKKLKAQKRYSKHRGYKRRMAHELKRKFLLNFLITTSIAFFFVTSFTVTTVSSEGVANSCIQCHSKPTFRIIDKQLYKYFRDWELSIHAQEGVTCFECHGGNPNSPDKKKAHGKDIQQLLTPVEYEQISVTCGKCHKENAENYKKSKHYRILTEKGRAHPTPTCVTCHGSINTSIPKTDDIANICASCHNAVTENNPENTEIARYLFKRLSYINYYSRFLISKCEPEEKQQFSKIIDEEFSRLAQIWHSLELDRIEEKTLQIRTMLMKKRKELSQADEDK